MVTFAHFLYVLVTLVFCLLFYIVKFPSSYNGIWIESPLISSINHNRIGDGDLDIIWVNLLHFRSKNFIKSNHARPSIFNFLRHGHDLRRKVYRATSEIASNTSVNFTLQGPLHSQTIIYNRIPKTGSATLLCK